MLFILELPKLKTLHSMVLFQLSPVIHCEQVMHNLVAA